MNQGNILDLKKLSHFRGTNKRQTFSIKGVKIGDETFSIIAGPCTIRNEEEMSVTAFELKKLGFRFFRGGAYKMRTSPFEFRGLGLKGLEIIKNITDKTGLISVSEVIASEDVSLMSEYVDILQVGTRSMNNYRLLAALGKVSNPVILKRGMSSTIREWLFAAEHIIQAGNVQVILCERGIRTFEPETRNTLDISAIPLVRNYSSLPILVDPSHSSGKRNLIKPLCWAAMAAGADGILLEAQVQPDNAICDADQTIDLIMLNEITKPALAIIKLWNKQIG
jgi:3-deoxy-7-phosphoheptulonate synthase